MVSLVEGEDGLVAYPTGKGSGAITSFAQADGFMRIDALADHLPAGTEAEVTLFTPHVRVPDLVIIGSHCTGLDLVAGAARPRRLVGADACRRQPGRTGRGPARRMRSGADPPARREDAGAYNVPFLGAGLELVPGWRRMQGIVYRAGDARFEGLDPSRRPLRRPSPIPTA